MKGMIMTKPGPVETYRILYIEDDVATATRVKNVLQQHNYEVSVARTVEDGRAAYASHAFDLIATDLNLPDGSGREIIEHITMNPPFPPIIVVTGFGDERTVVEVMKMGVSDYVPKDPGGHYVEILPHLIKQALEHANLQHSAAAISKDLEENRENLRTFLNNSSDLIYITDLDGNLLSWNPAFRLALGYSDAELSRLHFADIHQHSRQGLAREIFHDLKSEKLFAFSVPLQRRNEEVFEVETRVTKGKWSSKSALSFIARDVTKQREIERELVHSQSILREVIDALPELIYWKDTDQRYLGCNEQYAKRIGVDDIADLIGKTSREACGTEYPFSGIETAEYKVLESGDAVNHLVREIENQDGTIEYYDSSWIPLHDERGETIGVLGTYDNITERRKMQMLLRERERTLRIITDNMHDIIGLVSPNMVYKYVSPSHKQLLGADPSEFMGASPIPRIHPEDFERVGSVITEGLSTKQAQRVEFRFKHNAGHYLWLECIGTPILDDDGNVSSIVLASRDVTDRKRIEEELRQRKEELEVSNQELDSFSHTVAHDLKNPLNTLIGLANLLNESPDMSEEDVRESLGYIEESSRRMNSIIESLMVLAGVRKQDVTPSTVDMDEVVQASMERLEYFMKERRATVQVDELHEALGYAPWLEEVWVNYISNAAKYGGEPATIQLGSEKLSSGEIRYYVRDHGPGLTKEQQDKLFQPFERLNQVQMKGYGLGLSIVKRIVEKLGGTVGVNSAEGEGAEFYFTLPAPEPVAEANAVSSE